ncbi:FRIGIDA-like protein 3 [Phragmites australis]|uniref:FRIGIDA-like protein 3 n=1 Tax=Phragmites australis TaxID=29695 RepID=UPI002D78D35C|nr:FRIGIDA-like protein 3 [Phragmites australis]XP_062186593.1 FRIGIDA-like protein 3 [Phragmites australis]XP_062186594.1 FRIGIDA-like protein 3 [Phragmites australis]
MATEATLVSSGGSESTMPLLEQLAEVFGKMKSHTEASLQLQNGLQWEDIKEHFLNLDKSYRSKFDELVEKQKALEEKKAEACRLIAEKEVNVSAIEHASLNQLQELRDAAVSSLAEVRQKYKVELAEILDASGSKDKKVSISINDNNASRASEENTPASGLGEPSEASPVEIKPRPVLKQLCEQMDTKGLLNFLSENCKKLASLRDELSVALRCATDPARFVLDSLVGFFPPDQTNSPGNKHNALQVQRRSCIVLMEAISPALGTKEPGGNLPWSSEIKEQAKAIAEEWKNKLAEVDLDASNGYSLEAQAFLQLLTTFNVDSVLDEDELCKIVVAISRRKQTAVSCRSLGLNERIPGIIEELVKRHRQIDAVHFIQAFGLSETFPPAPLLKTYVEELNDSLDNNGDATAISLKDDPKSRELLALRAVIKCIEEYKLQKEYSLGPLQKRVSELKPKGEKRPSFEGGRNYAKKPRGSGVSFPRRPARSVGSAARRPAFSVGNWQRAPAPMPSHAPAPMPSLPDRYGVADRYHYTPPATTFDAGAFASYGEPYSAPKPFQYTPGSVAASYSSSQYKVAYGGPGTQPAASGYAAYASATGPSASSSYANYLGSGYRPTQQP